PGRGQGSGGEGSWRVLGSKRYKVKRATGAAPCRYGMSVSNRLSSCQRSLSVRVTSTASITGERPRTTNRRPPGRSHSRKRDGISVTAPDTTRSEEHTSE